jgi:hypothetical protein
MTGLPPIDERTMRATCERVLARRPDELAQTDADGSFTFSGSYKGRFLTTQKVHKHLLRDRGTGPQVWDREAAGVVLRRGTAQRGTDR